jgi:hypothetical protein
MTDQETIMYQILGAVFAMDAPIVFKGALITKLVLVERGFASVGRQTKDIDASWVGAPPSMTYLTETINQALLSFRALSPLGPELLAIPEREYNEKRTAGFSVVDTASGKEIVFMDIGVWPVAGSKVYHHGEIAIRGVLPTEILADKISVLSGRYIFRRAKDMVDVYALAHCTRIATSDIYEIQKMKGRELEDFSEFYSRQQDVEHAYNSLKGVEGKPAFAELYAYLEKFISPFAQKDETPRLWNISISEWEDAL